jgi:hypothetical protein
MGMKIRPWAMLVLLCLGSVEGLKGQTFVGQTFASLFFLDGKNVVEDKAFGLGLDEILRFDAYELLPGSTLSVKVEGAGIKTMEASYSVNPRGEVKTNFFFPKAKGKLNVLVKFTTKNGSPNTIRFFLKPTY